MREGPCAQEEEELEVPLRLCVRVAAHYHHPAAFSGRRPGIPERGDEIVYELRRSQTDFLRHPPLIAPRARRVNSPKASPS